MNPKDMTEEALFEACITAVRAWPDARTVDEGDRLLKLYKDTKAEILVRLASRLDESDVLRKENEELRDALIDARSWMDAGMFEDVPPQYTAMVANVDAMLSKESGASHE